MTSSELRQQLEPTLQRAVELESVKDALALRYGWPPSVLQLFVLVGLHSLWIMCSLVRRGNYLPFATMR